MSKSLAEMPAVQFASAAIEAGRLPDLQVRAAQAHGPVFKRVIPGDPPREFVFLVGPEANRFVLQTHRHAFSLGQGWTVVLGDHFGHGLLLMDGAEHAYHRKLWLPGLTAAFVTTYLPIIQRVIAQRTATWPARDAVDVYADARIMTFEMAVDALAGFPPGPTVDRLRRLMYHLVHGFHAAGDPETESGLMMGAETELYATLARLIAERRHLPADAAPQDVLGLLLAARDEDGAPLSDRQIISHLNILIVNGHETTTIMTAWALYLLATLPAYRERVLAELAALPGDPSTSSGQAPSTSSGQAPAGPPAAADIPRLPFLDAFIREVGRLYPPIVNLPRRAVEDVEFGGYTIPAGTWVRLALAAGHRLPHVFAQPEVFDPDRFVPPREEDRRTPYGLITFGGGPRICIGIHFAQLEVKATVAHVLRHYRLEALPGQEIVHAGHWNASPPGGIWLRFAPRAAATDGEGTP